MRLQGKYIPRSNKCVCDLCGFVYMAHQLRYNSDGLLVCSKDYEPEHPQDKFVGAKSEKIVPDKVRVEPTPIYREFGTTWQGEDLTWQDERVDW